MTFLLLAAFFLFTPAADAASLDQKKSGERILAFNSQIVVYEDGTMTVIETIQVRAEGREIRRGIYRDFPTLYRMKNGRRVVTGFQVIKVLKNGYDEPFHTDTLPNGVRVYIGSEDVYLKHGVYTYTLSYQTDRQIGFFPDHDELYWNVTGNGWAFPIDQAAALIQLPKGAARRITVTNAFTGGRGQKRKAYTISRNEAGEPTFVTTAPLSRGEGLTVFAAWPKGFVAPPDRSLRMMYFLRDYGGIVLGLLGLAFVTFYYLVVWFHVGRDPATGTIVPRFKPPKGLSPAAARFIRRMAYDDKTFTAAVVNMAVKGYLKIEDRKKGFAVERASAAEDVLSADEAKIGEKFFGRGKDEVLIQPSNSPKIIKTVEAFKKSLKANYEKTYFLKNTRYFGAGAALSALWIILSGVAETRSTMAVFFVFMSAVIVLFSVFIAHLIRRTLGFLTAALRVSRSRVNNVISCLVLGFTTVAFAWIGIYFVDTLLAVVSAGLLWMSTGIAALNYLFYEWLKAPTRAGRKVLDEVDGFIMYLSAAEKERLRALHPPDKTPQLFEKYLPYAIALDVEDAWASQFTEVLAASSKESDGGVYFSNWYHTSNIGSFSSSGFASSISSAFSGAISSASVAPGSSSGGGGGGSSGGGGGGGGGGGW